MKDFIKIEKEFRLFLDKYDGKTTKELVELFRSEFGLKQRTLFHWKSCAKLNHPLNSTVSSYRSIIDKRSSCYFCNKELKLAVHHIDLNLNNNNISNLLILCPKCHKRLHVLMIYKPSNIFVIGGAGLVRSIRATAT